jgi:TP901 family phage tail tape measure protein
MSAEATDAFSLFGDISVDLSGFDKAMDSADARLNQTSKTMGETGSASDRMAARINSAGRAVSAMRDALRSEEDEARKVGAVTKEAEARFAQLHAILDKTEASLKKTTQEFDRQGGSTKQVSGHVLSLENKVKSCERALRGEADALKETGKAADSAGQSYERLSDRVGKLGSGLKTAGAAMTAGITLPIVGAGIAAVKAASDVQTSVANISTIKPDVDTASLFKSLNQMQTRVPYAAGQLGDALYDVFGTLDVTQAQGTALVEKFARGATASMTNAQVFGSAMMGMMGAFGKSVGDADSVMDVFFNTVNRASNLTGSQLAPELGKVSAMASKAGVSMEELGALIVASTKGGGEASENINNVANMLQKLPMPEARKQLKALGVDVLDAHKNFRPILDVLGDLKTRLSGLSEGDKATALSAIFPDAQAQVGASTVMKFLDDANKALDENRGHTDSTAKAWQQMSATMGVQATLLKNSVMNALTQVGERLLPVIQPAVEWLAARIPSAVESIVTAFSSLPSAVQSGSLGFVALVAVLGPVAAVVGGVVAAVAAVGSTAAAIILAAVANIAAEGAVLIAAAAAIYEAWKNNFGGLRDFTTKVFDGIRSAVSAFVSFVTDLWAKYGEDIKSTTQEVWGLVRSVIEVHLREILAVMSAAWASISEDVKAAWPFVKTIIESALKAILAAVRLATSIMNGDWAKSWEAFKQTASGVNGIIDTLGIWIYTGLKNIAVKAYDLGVDIGAKILAGMLAGITNSSTVATIGAAMFRVIAGAGASARVAAASEGAAAGRAYGNALRANILMPDFGAGAQGAGPWLPGQGPSGEQSSSGKPGASSSVKPLANLPAGFGGGGHKGGGGSGGVNEAAEAEIKLAELSLRAAERLYKEGNSIFRSLYDFRQISLRSYVEREITLEEELLGKKLAVIQKERDAAEKLSGPKRKVALKDLDEKRSDAESEFEVKRAGLRDSVAKAEEDDSARQETLYQIVQESNRAMLAEVQSAGNERVQTAESVAKRVSEIKLKELTDEAAYLNRQLVAAGQDEKQKSDIKNKLALLEVKYGHAVEDGNRQVSEARRKDLEDYRQYARSLSDLTNSNLEESISLRRMDLDLYRRFGGDKAKALREEIRLDLEAEDVRHSRAKDDIERERREFEERKHTREQWEEFLKEHNKKVESEEERHRKEQDAARAKELEATMDRLKKIADTAGDILGKAIDAGVKGGFKEALRSIATDFAQLLRDLAVQLLKSYFLKLLQNLLNIQAPGAGGQGGSAGGSGSGWDIVKGIIGGIFGGGRNAGTNSTAKDVNQTLETVGGKQVDATAEGTSGTTDAVDGQGNTHTGLLTNIWGNGTNMLGVLNTIAAGQQQPAWATILKAGVQLAGSALSSKGGGGGSHGGSSPGAGGKVGAASGGFIFGPGTSISDSIPAMLSNGEYVVRAAVVQKLGRGYFDGLNAGRLPRFASDGLVNSTPLALTSHATAAQPARAARDRGGAGGNVHIHPGAIVINTPDANSFRQSQGQLEASLARMVQRGMRRL